MRKNIDCLNALPCMDAPRAFDAQETPLLAWIEKIAAKDENALAAFYDATVNRVYGLALSITRTSPAAEEVVSDVYLQVWQQAHRYDTTRGKVLAWLLTMCRSRALDSLRRHDLAEPCAEPELLLSDSHSSDDGPLDILLMVERNSGVYVALQTLDTISRQLLALSFFKGLSHQEIADHTRIPLGSVKSILRKAIAALKKMLHHNTLLSEVNHHGAN